MINRWIITEDVIGDGEENNVRGPQTPKDISPDDLPIFFKMFDDDSVLYYKGKMDKKDFHPLDDFGQPNTGCTSIHVSEDNVYWEIL